MDEPALRVACLSDWGPEWRWIEPRHRGTPPLDVRYVAATRGPLLRRLPGPNWGRVRAGVELAVTLRRHPRDVVVSHAPRNSHYAAQAMRGLTGVPHLAATFNFTDLPTGYRLDAMRRSFATVDRFAVLTEMERHLYADLFGLPVDRFRFGHWGVAPPIAVPGPRPYPGRYVAAIGGEARDYAVLCEAARRLPTLDFIVVARPASFEGLAVPPNLTVLVNRPWEETWTIAAHAEALLVPLRSNRTPNGIVTIVGAMHLGKAQVVTDSIGIHDYLADGETGLLAPAGDGAAFAAAIERLLDEDGLGGRLGVAAQAFATAHCNEQAAADAALVDLLEITGRPLPPGIAHPSTNRAAAR